MSSPLLSDSASGIRPAGAFVLLALVLAAIALWVGRLTFRPSHASGQRTESDPAPEFSIVDRAERPLAESVQRLDLVCSPNSLWQAHTPEHLVDELVRVFGARYTRDQWLANLIPDARGGVIHCSVAIDEAQARALTRWIRTGTFDDKEPARAIEGVYLTRVRSAWELSWNPTITLSGAMRSLHVPKDDKNPLRWSHKLADGLARALWGDKAFKESDSDHDLDLQRGRVWEILMPTNYAVVARDFEASCAPRLFRMLSDEGVLHWQMRIDRGQSRIYPMGAFKLLGSWGYVDAAAARQIALRKVLPETAANPSAASRIDLDRADRLKNATLRVLSELHPINGLELLCGRELSRPTWDGLERRPASYTFERHTPLRRKDPLVVPRTYYVDSETASETPRVVTTLDAFLQRRVGEELDTLMARNQPAIAMAIVVDLASGDVLAVDSREAYPFDAFAPIKHTFTPGSTFKVVVMSCALDQGVVEPNSVFDVRHGAYPLGTRVIREADNPGKGGTVTAAEILAYSLNAGMVQIGPRVPAGVLRSYFISLGYAHAPHSGLGPESSGFVPPLPWKPNWTHASVSFGHELAVTLWQHAAGLATILRGGEYLPLRVIDAVEQNGLRYALPREARRRVFQSQTCDEVREMMKLGAREGTGSAVASPALLPEIEVGTKTGTAQKVPSEVCLHVELEHQREHVEHHTTCSAECRKALSGKRIHPNCYTSSMCAFGRLHGSEREVMVLVVADEPRVGKYGSRVAGPTAIAILKEALGVTRLGESVVADCADGFAPSNVSAVELPELPWASADAEER